MRWSEFGTLSVFVAALALLILQFLFELVSLLLEFLEVFKMTILKVHPGVQPILLLCIVKEVNMTTQPMPLSTFTNLVHKFTKGSVPTADHLLNSSEYFPILFLAAQYQLVEPSPVPYYRLIFLGRIEHGKAEFDRVTGRTAIIFQLFARLIFQLAMLLALLLRVYWWC